MKAPKRFASASFFAILFIALIIALAVVKVTSSVLIPLTISIMISFVLEPLVRFVHQKLKIPNFLCILIVLCVTIVCLSAVVLLLVSSLKTILTQYPKYEQRFMIIYETIANMFRLPFDAELSLFSNLWEQAGVRNFIQDSLLSFSNIFIGFVKDSFLVFLFALFFLAEMRYFQQKLESAFADVLPQKISTIISNIMQQVARYMSVKFYVSLATGGLVYLGTLLLGMDFPIVWGFIAFVMNFIPNFGSIISSLLTILFALLQFWPNGFPVVVVAILMLGVNMLLGNLLEPRIQGKNLGISPFVILVSLSLWGWLWGFAGMVLAVPLMVIIKIICENVDYLYPVSVLLGTKVQEQDEKPLAN